MTAIATAKRRRKQARMNNAHLAKIGRPMYRVKSKAKQDRRRAEAIRREHERRQRGAKF